MKTLLRRLTLSISTGVVFSSQAAWAETIEYSCGNVEFTLNITQSTMSDRFSGERTVNWKYEDPRLLWKEVFAPAWSGVNIRSGAIIMNGVEDTSAGCLVGDAVALHELLSKTGVAPSNSNGLLFSFDEFQQDFESLPLAERKGIQRLVSEVYGIDIGGIDGIWGPRTGTTLIEMQSGFAERGWSIEEEDGATAPDRYSDFLVRLANYYGVIY